MIAATTNKSEITEIFQAALENNEFQMYLQPQFSESHQILGAEALVRWRLTSGKMIYPNEFIGILEQSNLISCLDRFVWEEAGKKLAQWKNMQIPLYISVNVSVRDFYDMDIYDVLTGIVEENCIDPCRLNLEITETVFVERPDQILPLIKKLKAYGFSIEIDDFGTGFSSLKLLQEIEPDTVKVDRYFVKESVKSQKSYRLLHKIVELIHEIDMNVIAEGVETEMELKSVKAMGCRVFQGYYFDRPLPVEVFDNKYALMCY